jgi:hypothetical protein
MSNHVLVDDYLQALNVGSWGRFPFGMPNSRRAPTGPTNAAVVVLGVYPSALHLSWRAPDLTTKVSALAVDVEPVVFWRGADGAARKQHIDDWKRAVGADTSFGTFGWSGLNGISGTNVDENYLGALGVQYDCCLLTDCIPFYFVKKNKGEQGDTIDRKWRNYADSRAWNGGRLPNRPASADVVALAAHPARTLAREIAASEPRAIITLGQEAADAVERVGTVTARPPGLPLQRNEDYGRPGQISLAGHRAMWIPLAHPGATGRKGPWQDRHREWQESAGRLLSE